MISRPFVADPLIVNYGKALWEARWAARIVGFLHIWSTFLSFCSLTWATVVLLGAYVSALHLSDYSFVAALLLLEAARLASATFLTHILTRSPDPGHLNQVASHDLRHRRLHRSRFLSAFFQVLLIAASFTCAIIRLLNTRFYVSPGGVKQLQISLRIFYVLIIANAAVSSLGLSSFMAWICLKRPSELSILRYYDEVLHNILANGVIQADGFNFFQYAFKMLGRDYAKCESLETVMKSHKMLLKYMYAHKQGADYLQICLNSEDASVRQAAANMVGMWADEKRGVGLETKDLELPPELLMKLADMVGTGEVGWAATNSFGALAKRNPQYLVQTLTSSKEPVLHRIAQLVYESSTRSLACVRTLVLFYNQIFLQRAPETEATTEMRPAPAELHGHICCCQPCEKAGEQYTREDAPVPAQEGDRMMEEARAAGTEELRKTALPKRIEEELLWKLQHLLKKSKVQRLRVHSAYLLHLLDNLDDPCYQLIREIDPSIDTYWYEIEQKMLEFFLRENPPPTPPSYPRIVPDQEVIYEGPISTGISSRHFPTTLQITTTS